MRTASGNDWVWCTTRFALYARDGFACVACKSREKLSLDHVERGGSNKPHNLITLCKKCNSSKGGHSLKAWRPELVDEVLALLASPIDRLLGRELALEYRPGRLAQHEFRTSPAERARRAAKRAHDEAIALETFEAFCRLEDELLDGIVATAAPLRRAS